MLFEKSAEVQQWLSQCAVVAQQQRKQQAANAAIAVAEWMNRFELIVSDRQPYEKRIRQGGVEKALEVVERRLHLLHRRRNVDRIVQPSARRADPILRLPKLAGR